MSEPTPRPSSRSADATRRTLERIRRGMTLPAHELADLPAIERASQPRIAGGALLFDPTPASRRMAGAMLAADALHEEARRYATT